LKQPLSQANQLRWSCSDARTAWTWKCIHQLQNMQ